MEAARLFPFFLPYAPCARTRERAKRPRTERLQMGVVRCAGVERRCSISGAVLRSFHWSRTSHRAIVSRLTRGCCARD